MDDQKKIEKWKKSLHTAGTSASALGWIGIFLAPTAYLAIGFYGLQAYIELGLADTVLGIAWGFVLVVLGNRIKEGKDKNIKYYLQILVGLSGLLLALQIVLLSRPNILLIFLFLYLLMALVSVGRLMKVEEFKANLISPEYKVKRKHWIIFAAVTTALFFVAVGIDLSTQGDSNYSLQENSTQTQNARNNSKADLISETVREIKAAMSLPNQIDEATMLVDITAESNAIRYHYILSEIDTSQLSNSYLKSFLGSSICKNADTKNLLNYGINMEYSYMVKGSVQKYFVSFTKNDCSQ